MPTDIFVAAFAAILAFTVVGSLAAWLTSRPLHATWLILGLIVLDAAKMEPIAFKLGILLYPEDIVFLILGISGMIRITLMTQLKTVPRTWWIIGAVQLALFIWGTSLHGTAAGVDYRTHFYLWVAVVYFASITWTESLINRVANAWIVCAVGLCMVVYYRWIASATDPIFAQKMMALDTTGVRFRVIGSGPALMIAIASLVIFFKMIVGKASLMQRLYLPMFLLTVIVLQHRSVWASLVVGIVCVLWALQRGRMGGKALIGVIVMAIPLLFFFAAQDQGSGVAQSVKSSAGQAISTQEGTMVGRVAHWQELIRKWADSHSVATYLVGKPYGSGYNPVTTDDGALTIDMVPHNHFVHMLYRGGLIGLAATLLLFYRLWQGAVTQLKVHDKPWAPYFVALFATLFAFYIPYWATYGHGVLIGIAISYLGIARPYRIARYQTTLSQSTISQTNLPHGNS